VGAADVELTPADLREIESAASQIAVQSARVPQDVLAMTNGQEKAHASRHVGVLFDGFEAGRARAAVCCVAVVADGVAPDGGCSHRRRPLSSHCGTEQCLVAPPIA